MERLQKIIANRGYTSRRKAEELILAGRVKVGGNVVNELGLKFDEDIDIKIDNKLLKNEKKEYYLLNKPRGVISTSNDDKDRKTVIDYIDTKTRIYPVGRLDYDTTGAIILTNDGDLTNFLTHPSNEIDKVYIAKINGIMDVSEINKLKNGVIIDNYKTKKAKVKIKKKDIEHNTSIVEITIHEGKNHQVKKMFQAIGYDVLKLKRERIGFLTIKNIDSGCYVKLTENDIKELYNLAK